jgi:endonuclease YncB( thermonuclease family)
VFSAAKAIRVLMILALLAGAAALFRDRIGTPLAGPATAIDGDSLRIAGEEVRLSGLDAPEFDQICGEAKNRRPCGREAHQFLKRLLGRGVLNCDPEGSDRYGRTLARCWLGRDDIGARIVQSGNAIATDGYVAEETAARSARKGIWAGPFDLPAEWRKANAR